MRHETIPLPPSLADALGIPRAPRAVVEGLISLMIDDLDQLDGDHDLEDNMAEDDFTPAAKLKLYADGPGCSVSDADKGTEDEGEYTHEEWHTLPSSTRRAGGIRGNPLPGRFYLAEDDEEDDPSGVVASEDEPDMRGGIAGYGPGCIISDPDACAAGDDRIVSGGGPYMMRDWELRFVGSEDDGERQWPRAGRYGIDQTLGPLDHHNRPVNGAPERIRAGLQGMND